MGNSSPGMTQSQPNKNMPMNLMMMQQPQKQMAPQQMSYGYPQAGQPYQYAQQGYQPQPGYAPAPMGGYGQSIGSGASVLAPGMLNPVAPRKAIPDASTGRAHATQAFY